jgi:Lrp/AsnC family transcriptional regulator, regulator for asnA, asnC and gidA
VVSIGSIPTTASGVPPSGSPDLDELDFRIIGQLQDDGRKPSSEIARVLGVPRTTVARRIERLVNDKIITIGVFADGSRIGLPVHAMILMQVAPNRYKAVISAVSMLDEVRWVGVLSGPFDLLIEAMLPSNEDLRHLLLDKLPKIDGITQMQTAHVLEVSKIAFDWNRMLNVDRQPEAEAAAPPPSPPQIRRVGAWRAPARGASTTPSAPLPPRRASRPQ